MNEKTHRQPSYAPWWLILSLVGLDYFSTLAYLPSLAVQAVGAIAPLAAAIVSVTTLCVAAPVYCYVLARSPDGTGATGLIERLVTGWRGKLFVLLLLSFVATDYVVTQNLSIADAAEHLRANELFQSHVQPPLDRLLQTARGPDRPWWSRMAGKLDSQLLVTLVLLCSSFAMWAFWQSGSTRRFLHAAAVVVTGYMSLSAIIIVTGLVDLAGAGSDSLAGWQSLLSRETGSGGTENGVWWRWCVLVWHGFVAFPFVALGLSGFELSMAVAPMVRADAPDGTEDLRLRVRRMRLLLISAALLMALWLPGAVLVTSVHIPESALRDGGAAVHRALAYLAHGGVLVDGRTSADMNPIFGRAFGCVYDAFSIAILCMAGASVIIALREYVPDYLQRMGMEMDIAQRLGVKMRFFNVIVLAVGLWFGASIARMQWAYATSVVALLSGASLAAVISIRHERRSMWIRTPLAVGAAAFLLAAALLCMLINSSGLEIAVWFAAGIIFTSAYSRWFRSTELRWQGFDFTDDESRRKWEKGCSLEFQILVPHRPGQLSRPEKEQTIRNRHRLDPATPIILVEVELGDPSEFYQRPLLRIVSDDGVTVMQVSRAASISHVLAAVAMQMSRVGRPAEVHCGWSDESPVAANLNFLLFGEGNVPWMVRELIRRAEPDPSRRPRVILG